MPYLTTSSTELDVIDAQSTWEQWSATDFDHKRGRLSAFQSVLEEKHPMVAKVVSFHLRQASILLAKPLWLEGPTGETNELYTVGRGIVLAICENDLRNADHALHSAVAIIACALIAGNGVVVCSDNAALNPLVEQTAERVDFPPNLVQVVGYDAAARMIEGGVRQVGYVGHDRIERELNRQLAKRDGPIGGLVAETDLESPTLVHDPYLSLRFVTERTRTINTTAVGGNPNLLDSIY